MKELDSVTHSNLTDEQLGLVSMLCSLISYLVTVMAALCWGLTYKFTGWTWLVFAVKVTCPLAALGSLFVGSLLAGLGCFFLARFDKDKEELSYPRLCFWMSQAPFVGITLMVLVFLIALGEFLFTLLK